MNTQSMSLWMSTTPVANFKKLEENVNADVCIVGAGISGLTTAYFLAQSGKSVIVLDDGPVGWGETSRTTAHWVTALDDRYYELERLHGREGAALAAHSHRAAIDMAESIITRENIDCNFQRIDGYLILHPGGDPKILDREFEALHRVGLRDVELVDHAPGLPWTGRAIMFPNQAQLHPLKYIHGLAQAATKMGVRIHTYSHVDKIKNHEVITDGGFTVRAEHVVVATNSPVNDIVTIHTKQAAYRSYVVGFRVPRYSVPRIL